MKQDSRIHISSLSRRSSPLSLLSLLLLLLLLVIVPVSAVVIAEQGFSREIPEEPYDVAYDMYFHNYDNVRLCTLSAIVNNNSNKDNNNNNNNNNSDMNMNSNRTRYTYWGCTINTASVNSHVLMPITIEEAVEISSAKNLITTTTTNNNNNNININISINSDHINSLTCSDVDAAQILLGLLQTIKHPYPLTAPGIAIVLFTRNTSLSTPLTTETETTIEITIKEKENVKEERKYDMTCFLAAVNRYNEIDINIRRSAPLITAVAFSDDQQHLFFSGSSYNNNINNNDNPFTYSTTTLHQKVEEEELLLVPREVRTAYNFNLLYFPINKSKNEWKSIMHAAEMNRVRWKKGYMYPQALLETRSGMKLAETTLPTSIENVNNNSSNNNNININITSNNIKDHTNQMLQDRINVRETSLSVSYTTPSCLTYPNPSCAPLGGWTVWATNADTQWEWNNNNNNNSNINNNNNNIDININIDNNKGGFVKKTRKGAVALLVASTAVSLIHNVVPGADCPASAIVTALAAMEALRRLDITTINNNNSNSTNSNSNSENRDVYVFFFPGEHVGRAGSGRFIADATWLSCVHNGLDNCTALAYKSYLNFTTVDFTAIDTFIVVDQVGYGAAPLFYHVDSRVSNFSTSTIHTNNVNINNNNSNINNSNSNSKREKEEKESAQEKAEALLQELGVKRAGTSQLPYSPITTVLDFLSTHNLNNINNMNSDSDTGREKVFLTLSRYNTTYVNPNVFTVLDQVGDENTVNMNAVAEAADTLLRLLLLHTNNNTNNYNDINNNNNRMKTIASDVSAVVDRRVVQELWECFTSNIRCNYLFPYGDADGNTDPLIPDYSVGAMIDNSHRHSSSSNNNNNDNNSNNNIGILTPTQAAIEASLKRFGWPQTLRSPAVSLLLRIPQRDWNGPWEYDEHWIEQVEQFNNNNNNNNDSSHYALHVVSLWEINIGARGIMVGCESASFVFLLMSIIVGGCFLLFAQHCLK